ncbi:MAG: porin [Pelistega sp.]|nr:porin [Pelistega sp.]
MKKTLLAAALVTGFAGVAHAESSVTLYGLVDAGYGYKQQKVSSDGVEYKNRNIGARNNVKNGSRWGMKGVEDLGNGTSAIFQLEGGFTPGDGKQAQGGRLFGRQAFVGLTGESWGTFTIGRQYNAADAFIAPIDPFGTGWAQAASNSAFGDSVSTRYDNAIKYVSPNFGGFQFGLGVVHDDTKETWKDAAGTRTEKTTGSGVTFGAGYNAGPLALGVSFDYLRNKQKVNGQTTTDDKTKAWNLGAAYDLDVVKLHAIVGQQRDGVIGGLGLADDLFDNLSEIGITGAAPSGKGLRQTSWLAGVTAPVGDAGKVLFSYTGNRIKHNDFGDARVKTNIFSLGYQHNLSKRTQVYALASYGQSKLTNRGANLADVKLKSTDVAVGLQHRF